MKRKAFTWLEFAIIMSCIAILVAIALPAFMEQTKNKAGVPLPISTRSSNPYTAGWEDAKAGYEWSGDRFKGATACSAGVGAYTAGYSDYSRAHWADIQWAGNRKFQEVQFGHR